MVPSVILIFVFSASLAAICEALRYRMFCCNILVSSCGFSNQVNNSSSSIALPNYIYKESNNRIHLINQSKSCTTQQPYTNLC